MINDGHRRSRWYEGISIRYAAHGLVCPPLSGYIFLGKFWEIGFLLWLARSATPSSTPVRPAPSFRRRNLDIGCQSPAGSLSAIARDRRAASGSRGLSTVRV